MDSVVLVVTATEATAESFVTVYPAGSTRPTSSNLNPTPGITTANTVVAKVGTDGEISIFNSSGSVHVIADVHGWFPTTSAYTSLVPARVMDSRSAYSTIDGMALGAGALTSGQSVDLQVAGRGGVPATGVTSVVVNVTAVNQTEPTYITVHPTGSLRPNASNLNPMPGVVTSNVVVATVGTAGQISLYNNAGTVDVIVDVQGWFGPGDGFTPVGPARVVDTRVGFATIDGVDAGGGTVGAAAVTTFRVTGRAGVPATGVGAVAINVTAINQTLLTHLTVYPAGTPRPTASVLNPKPGLVASNLVIAKVSPAGEISIFNLQGSLDLIVDIAGWFPSDVQAAADSVTVAEDSAAAVIDVLANDDDHDGAPVTIASATQPSHGAVTLIGGTPGARTSSAYRPDADYCGPDSFTYTLNGGVTATVTITVVCVADDPTAVADRVTVTEDAVSTSLSLLLDNDTDIDGGPRSIGSVTQPANGTVTPTISGTAVDYQPDADYCNTHTTGRDTFTYALLPGATSATVSITVTCVNDGPSFTAGSDVFVALNAGPESIPEWATDISAGPHNEAAQTVDFIVTNDNNALFSTPPAVSPSGTLSFAAADDASGAATVSVRLHDDGGTDNSGVDTSAQQTFEINVNNPPTAAGQSISTDEDTPVVVTVAGADDDGDPLTFAAATGPSAGSLGTFTAPACAGTPSDCTSTITYSPAANSNGADSFTFRAHDGDADSPPATVNIMVDPVNDEPTFTVGGDQTVSEDSGDHTVAAWATAISAGPPDESGQSVTLAVTNDNNSLFDTLPAIDSSGVLTFTPADNAFGSAEVSVTPSDDGGTANGGDDTGTVQTFTITVTAVNDEPRFTVGADQEADEDSSAQTIDPWATGIGVGPGEGGQTATFTVDNDNPALFSAGPTVDPTGVLTFTPQPDAFGSAIVTVAATDDGGTADGGDDTSADQTFTIGILPVDDAPTAVDDSRTVGEDGGAATFTVLSNDEDIDAGPISVTSVTQPAHGTVSIPVGGANVRYTPTADYCNTTPGDTDDTFTYTLAPGGSTAMVSVTVTCADDPPVAVADSATVLEDAAATAITVLANDTDIDAGPQTIASVTQPTNGTVIITGGGTGLTYAPDTDYCNTQVGGAPDTFDYTLDPGASSAAVDVTVTCADDPPVAVADSATVLEDAAATAITVLANDTDIDAGPKTIASVTPSADTHGTVAITGGGTGLTYRPTANYCNTQIGGAAATFTYTLNGGSTATVTITVTCVADNPTAVADSRTVAEDSGSTTFDVLSNDSNPDAVAFSITSVTQPANGSVSITGAGQTVSYAPTANYCNSQLGGAPATFDYTLTPGGSQASVSVDVTCVDDSPTAVADSATVLEDAAATAVAVLTNDTDIDAGPKTIASVTQPTNGTVVITGGGTGLTYAPNANYCNSPPGTTLDTFNYTVTPGDTTAAVTMTVTCADDPPVAVADSATMLEDAAATAITVLANDTDIDAGPKTVASVTPSATTHGTVAITGGGTGLSYRPDADYCNDPPGTTPATFTYTLNGGSSATVSVTVTCVNDAPTPDNESFSGADRAIGNTSLVVNDPTDGAPNPAGPQKTVTGDVLDGDTDIDGPGPLVVVAGQVASTDGGTAVIEADGDFTFTPAAGTSCTDTSDSFAYTVSDQASPVAATATGTVTITIADCVWYVDDDAVAGGNGTSAQPLNALTGINGAGGSGDADGSNQTVFVFAGTYANTTPGFQLENGQRLLAGRHGLVVPDGGGGVGTVTLEPAGGAVVAAQRRRGARHRQRHPGNRFRRRVDVRYQRHGGGHDDHQQPHQRSDHELGRRWCQHHHERRADGLVHVAVDIGRGERDRPHRSDGNVHGSHRLDHQRDRRRRGDQRGHGRLHVRRHHHRRRGHSRHRDRRHRRYQGLQRRHQRRRRRRRLRHHALGQHRRGRPVRWRRHPLDGCERGVRRDRRRHGVRDRPGARRRKHHHHHDRGRPQHRQHDDRCEHHVRADLRQRRRQRDRAQHHRFLQRSHRHRYRRRGVGRHDPEHDRARNQPVEHEPRVVRLDEHPVHRRERHQRRRSGELRAPRQHGQRRREQRSRGRDHLQQPERRAVDW